MKKAMASVVIVMGIVSLWKHVTETPSAAPQGNSTELAETAAEEPELAVERPDFRCDGRVYCREMTSCAEAQYFLDHCPGVKMDGEGDGIPCEDQWCGHH